MRNIVVAIYGLIFLQGIYSSKEMKRSFLIYPIFGLEKRMKA